MRLLDVSGTPSLVIIAFVKPKKLGNPAGIEMPAPQKKTTSP
jgi:hypothetical protein